MLDNINKKTPFTVPENYFENFHKELMEKIPQEKKAKVLPMWKKIFTWSAVAAAVCGIYLFVDIPSTATVPQLANGKTEQDASSKSIYASSEEDEFYQYLEDEVIRKSYNDIEF